MPMQQIVKKCPYCGNVYEHRACGSLGKKAQPEDVWMYGSPMKLCDKCKKIFIDKDIKEMAFVPPRKTDLALISPQTKALLPIGAGVAVLLYILKQPGFACAAVAVAVIYLLMDLAWYPARMKKLKKEKAASEKRMSDPEYARALKKAGIDVPDRYLKGTGNHKDGTESEVKA